MSNDAFKNALARITELGGNFGGDLDDRPDAVTWVELRATPATGDDLRLLHDLPDLTDLYIGMTDIVGDDLAQLAGLPKLDHIDLSRTRLRDCDLHYLKRLPALKTVDVEKTWVTARGAAQVPGVFFILLPKAGDRRAVELPRPKIEGRPGNVNDALWARLSTDFPLHGRDEIQWLNGQCASDSGLTQLAEPPAIGDLCVLGMADSSKFTRGIRYWLLFLPWPAADRGWPECPHLMKKSGLVYCEAFEFAVRDDGTSQVAVEVLDVVLLPDFAQRFDPVPDGPAVPMLVNAPPGYTTFTSHEDLYYINMNLESDVGVWAVCQKTPTHDRMLLFGYWGSDWNIECAGHRILTEEEKPSIGAKN